MNRFRAYSMHFKQSAISNHFMKQTFTYRSREKRKRSA